VTGRVLFSALAYINCQAPQCCSFGPTNQCPTPGQCCFSSPTADIICPNIGANVSNPNPFSGFYASLLFTAILPVMGTPAAPVSWNSTSVACQAGFKALACGANTPQILGNNSCSASGAVMPCCASSCVSIVNGACSAVVSYQQFNGVEYVNITSSQLCAVNFPSTACTSCGASTSSTGSGNSTSSTGTGTGSSAASLPANPLAVLFAVVVAYFSL